MAFLIPEFINWIRPNMSWFIWKVDTPNFDALPMFTIILAIKSPNNVMKTSLNIIKYLVGGFNHSEKY